MKKEQLRVWLMRNFKTTKKEVASVNEAKKIIRKAIKSDLKNSLIIDNAFGLEVYENNRGKLEWCEWYNEETGNDICQEIDEEDEK